MKTLPLRIAWTRDSILAVKAGTASKLPLQRQPPPGMNWMEWMNREVRAPYNLEETMALDELISGKI